MKIFCHRLFNEEMADDVDHDNDQEMNQMEIESNQNPGTSSTSNVSVAANGKQKYPDSSVSSLIKKCKRVTEAFNKSTTMTQA